MPNFSPGSESQRTAGASTRGQRLYDRWSRHRGALEAFYAVVFLGRERELRRRSIDALGLAPGDRVLELGCGPGNSLDALRSAVGEAGRVVGVDYSAGMVGRAAQRVRDTGWANVHVVRGDATRLGIDDGAFDAVYAAMSLSAMADPEAAVREAARCLRPGGRLVVLDARPFRTFPGTVLNPVVVPLATWLTNWVPAVDIPAALRDTFATVSVDDYNAGTLFVATARKGDDG